MNPDKNYVIQTDIKFGALEKIDIGAIEKACDFNWFNQTLCREEMRDGACFYA